MKIVNFRQFMELTAAKPLGHLDALKDELGIRPDDLKGSPYVAGNIKLGDTFNLATYKIMGYNYDSHGNVESVKIKLFSDPTFRTQKKFTQQDDKYVRMPNDQPEDKVLTIPINQFNQLMSQGLNNANMGAGAGGAPMLPGM